MIFQIGLRKFREMGNEKSMCVLLANPKAVGKTVLVKKIQEDFENVRVFDDLTRHYVWPQVEEDHILATTNELDPGMFKYFDLVIVNITPKTYEILKNVFKGV
jgi:nicotinamide riboside kinase